MFNLKQLIILFLIGFLLSFFSGIFGGVSFGIIFIRALISGALILIVAFAAMAVYNKFLSNVDTSDMTVSENTAQDSVGTTVDIVVDDDLPDSASAPSFDLSQRVTDNAEVADSTSSAQVHEVQEIATPAAFQTSSLDSITSGGSVSAPTNNEGLESLGTEPVPTPAREVSPVGETAVSSADSDVSELTDDDDSELGMLPDIESLGIEDDGDAANAADELVQDSVFAETGEVRPITPTAAPSEMGDAKEIAAAIRTALVKDM